MSKLPYMKLFWPDFFGDARVAALSTEGKGIYLLLLGIMWTSGGWIAADDRVIARRLGLDVRVWRSRFKGEIVPLLSDFQAPLVPAAFTQKRLQKELSKAVDLRAIRIANLGMSEAEYERNRTVAPTKPARGKRAQAGHQTGRPNSAPKSAPEQPPQGRAIAHSSDIETTSPVTLEPPSQAAGRAADPAERSGPTPHNIDAAALPPRAMPQDEPAPAEDTALQRRLVADGLKRGGQSLSDLVRELTGGTDANRKG